MAANEDDGTPRNNLSNVTVEHIIASSKTRTTRNCAETNTNICLRILKIVRTIYYKDNTVGCVGVMSRIFTHFILACTRV